MGAVSRFVSVIFFIVYFADFVEKIVFHVRAGQDFLLIVIEFLKNLFFIDGQKWQSLH
jgi:hypothetical protein